MKTLLITGFDPFGGETINPSWEAVSRLPDTIGDYSLTKLRIPVIFSDAANKVIEVADRLSPDAILCIGQAGGRDSITPEMVGINLRYAKIPDNNGYMPKDESIIPDGEAAFFSTVPVRKICDAINNNGIQSYVSYSAGTYVCNDLLYTLLYKYASTCTKIGFIHIPYSKEQNKDPSMELNSIIKGLQVAIECT